MKDAAKKGRLKYNGKLGVEHWNAKLTSEDIPAIRTMHDEGYSQIQLGKIFGVSNRQIGNVVNGDSWNAL